MSATPSTHIKYPKAPSIEGALPLDDLVIRATRNKLPALNDYDLLLAALVLNHRPSVHQALAVGAPIVEDATPSFSSGSSLYIISCQYHSGYGGYGAVGSEAAGIGYLRDLLPSIAKTPQVWRESALDSMLTQASARGSFSMVRELVSMGANFLPRHQQSALTSNVLHAICRPHVPGRIEFLDTISEQLDIPSALSGRNIDGMTPLLCAVDNFDQDCIHRFLEWGADPLAVSNDGSNMLHYILNAANSNPGSLSGFLQRLPDDLHAPLSTMVNRNGYYPIHEAVAVGYNSKTMPWKLLAPGGNIDIHAVADCPSPTQNLFPGLSPLGLAFYLGDTTSVVGLLRAGASLEKLTPQGHSAWHILADLSLSGHLKDIHAVRFLVKVLDKLNVGSETVVNGASAYSLPASDEYRAHLSLKRKQALATPSGTTNSSGPPRI